jgi:hypothetical protein
VRQRQWRDLGLRAEESVLSCDKWGKRSVSSFRSSGGSGLAGGGGNRRLIRVGWRHQCFSVFGRKGSRKEVVIAIHALYRRWGLDATSCSRHTRRCGVVAASQCRVAHGARRHDAAEVADTCPWVGLKVWGRHCCGGLGTAAVGRPN